jgi:hypothetical protein
MTLPDHIARAAACASLHHVGATRLSVVCACALALVIAPTSVAATGDLTVSVSRLEVPAKIVTGKRTSLSVRYVVHGPASRRAKATVKVVLLGTSTNNKYQISSNATLVRPAIWDWGWRDALPKVLGKGLYRVTATVTLTRSGKTISTAKRTATTRLS